MAAFQGRGSTRGGSGLFVPWGSTELGGQKPVWGWMWRGLLVEGCGWWVLYSCITSPPSSKPEFSHPSPALPLSTHRMITWYLWCLGPGGGVWRAGAGRASLKGRTWGIFASNLVKAAFAGGVFLPEDLDLPGLEASKVFTDIQVQT